MSLSIALNNALTGLNVNQKALAVLSQNIANANTAGYSRQIINQQALYRGNEGAGVGIADISRRVDEYLARTLRLQNSVAGRAEVTNDYYSRTQLLFGGPGGQNLNSYTDDFFNALSSLSVTPESSSLRAGAVRSASTFTREANRLANELQILRFEADKQIKSVVDSINSNISELYSLNIAIAGEVTAGQNPVGFYDRRDAVLRDLAGYVDIQTFTRENGAVNVFTGNGVNLVDEDRHLLTYTPVSSSSAFIDNISLGAIEVRQMDAAGVVFGNPQTLVSSGTSSQVTSALTSGTLKGLLDMRDRELPGMLSQLDMYASTLRDQFNAVHNAGVPYPGLASYTGTRSVFSDEYRQWSGNVRIAVLNQDGTPAASHYSDEASGFRPLTLNLSQLNTGIGNGLLSMQGLVDEINRYFAPSESRVTLGNMNNIRVASGSNAIPGVPPEFTMDFDLENISNGESNFFVTGWQVLDDGANDITSVAQDVPTIALAATGTYQTVGGTNAVTVTLASPPSVSVGDRIYLSTPGAPVDGIPAAELGGYVTVTSISGNSFTFETATNATAGGSFNVGGQTAREPYSTINAGEQRRTTTDGAIRLDLSGNTASAYYTVVANVGVVDENGVVSTSQITYRIDAAATGARNKRYAAQNANGDGSVVLPSSSQGYAKAMLVDASGNELPKFNGVYTTAQKGYLKIVADSSSHVIAIDSLDSQEQGQPTGSPPLAGTGRAFSHYFGLNNLFVEPDSSDTLTNASLNLQVRADIVAKPDLISLGKLVQTAALSSTQPLYTYERQVGDNSAIAQLAGVAEAIHTFSATGGLGISNQTFGGYLAQIISTASVNANGAQSDMESAELLREGYAERSDSVSGVNLDEELANTIIYQNAYTASARALSVMQELFQELFNSFRG
ncbi:MAG: flagellar hook-associated protein FlgK [Alphaproteobacteria bacterium]